ncbi:MAG: phenylacetate--CoA ligase family protein [Nitrososphaerota archaeon]|nr:phenylacetate--CoA ligase family protein [Nitrososphaerota archaeon]
MTVLEALYYLRSLRSYKLPRRELEELQAKKLRGVLAHLEGSSPKYRRMLRQKGLGAEDFRRIEDIRKLPFSTKADLVREQQGTATGGRAHGKVITSSGTTGRRVALARTRERGAVNRALSLRTMFHIGIMPWSRVATLWGPREYWKREVMKDGSSRPYTTSDDYPVRLFGRNLPNLLALQTDLDDPGRDARALREFGPDFIYSRPSFLRRIARAAGTPLGVEPRAIVATGETVTETGLRELRRDYGAKVIRNFGNSDVGKIGSDCLYEAGLHTWEDFKVFEILKDGEPVSEGEVGELVVTTLYRDASPRVRYRTGDYVRLGERTRCECGSSTTRIASVEGRKDDCLFGRTGARIWGNEVSDHLESAFGLRDFRLVQDGAEYTLKLPPGEAARFALGPALGAYLEEMTSLPAHLQVDVMDQKDYWVKARPVTCVGVRPEQADLRD